MYEDHYVSFVLIAAGLIVVPGPNVLLIVSNAISQGRRRGLKIVAGTSSAMALQLLVATFGMSSLMCTLSTWASASHSPDALEAKTPIRNKQMSTVDALVDKHYGYGGIMEKIGAGLKLAGKDVNSLTVDDLAPIDEFHSRGCESTLEVAERADIKTSDLVLDVGGGLGGTARHLAEQYRCNVAGIDLTEEYVSVGKKLTELVGLSDCVELCHGSALDIPHEDEKFDLCGLSTYR